MAVPAENALRVLVLGGTTEAGEMLQLLVADGRFAPTLSLAGRTANPVLPDLPCRVGGFGGIEGLRTYLREDATDLVVDATHPFAHRISANAAEACAAEGVARVAIDRPCWQAGPGDRWLHAADMEDAVRRLKAMPPSRVFLTVGRLELDAFAGAPAHDYLYRVIDPLRVPPPLLRQAAIVGRGPFDEAAERDLMACEGISLLVTKNSGARATAAKLRAARALGVPVLMVGRPPAPPPPAFPDARGAMGWIAAHAMSRQKRGV